MSRRSWLARHDPALLRAERRAAALGAAVHAELLAAGDRLAELSMLLAQRAFEHAPAAWARFGRDGFRRWYALGQELAAAEPACREGALAYFAVPPADFGAGGVDTAAAWCALGRGVARASRRLAAAFFARTPPLLRRSDGLARLGAWVETGLRLAGTRGWRGAFLAQAWFEAAPAALVAWGPGQYALWADVGAAFAGEAEERAFFATPPDLESWAEAERESFLRATLVLADRSSRHARIFYRELPPALAALAAPVRAALLRVFARLDGRVAASLAGFVPVAGAIVEDVPAAERIGALAMVEALGAWPEAAVAALCVLPRLYEDATPEAVRRWFATGTAVAAESPVAGRAYFALESRTSVRVLRASSIAASLDESEGVWRKLVQMLSGEGVAIRGVEGLTLRPPLEDFPAEREAALPFKVECLATHEENCRVYRFLAAHVAGRREFGTYASGDLRTRLARPGEPALLQDLFLLAEGVRIQHRIAATYPGLAAEARWLGTGLLERWGRDHRPSRGTVLDALLALVLGAEARPPWLPAEVIEVVVAAVVPLAAPTATVEDALSVARRLAGAFAAPALRLPDAESTPEFLLDDVTGGDPIDGPGPDGADVVHDGQRAPERAELQLGADADGEAGGQPLGPEALRRLLEAGARIGQGRGAFGGGGLPITDLIGKLPQGELDALRELLANDGGAPARPGTPVPHADERAFFYDEWDHRIRDYRSRWCRLQELAVAGDSGEFFARTLADYAALLPEVRRQFQRIRPEMYRPVRGLEDGEDFDLNAVTDARVDVRARRAPSTRLYRSRVREARDVATLFLLDMSASTDEPLAPLAGGRPARRIIDALKEALVIMTEALDELGDAYAIYGFSGQGRANVEFYLVKGFGEPLGASVKSRIGGITPRRSTRMGPALRHAVRKMAAVGARAKHLVLLSDGFPQDDDYGEDRRSHVYGIRDTAVALREADAAGITPFCITVDRAGHDYLREMCDPSRYLVIDDIAALPRELPKIYRRVVRA